MKSFIFKNVHDITFTRNQTLELYLLSFDFWPLISWGLGRKKKEKQQSNSVYLTFTEPGSESRGRWKADTRFKDYVNF